MFFFISKWLRLFVPVHLLVGGYVRLGRRGNRLGEPNNLGLLGFRY